MYIDAYKQHEICDRIKMHKYFLYELVYTAQTRDEISG